MAENEEKIVLTLGEEKVEEETLSEEEVKEEVEIASVPVSDVVGYAKLDDSSLSEEENKMVNDFAQQSAPAGYAANRKNNRVFTALQQTERG